MNAYFSRAEKISMTRLMLLANLLKLVIGEYEKINALDKEFIKDLRTAHTWTQKAIKRRFDFLSLDAAKDFAKHVDHMEVIFCPNDAAKKYFDRIKEMQSAVHMTMDEFEIFYSGIVPYTCGNCHKKEYRKCNIWETFRRLQLDPVDNNAKGCPYNYLDAGINLLEWAKDYAKRHGREFNPEQDEMFPDGPHDIEIRTDLQRTE